MSICKSSRGYNDMIIRRLLFNRTTMMIVTILGEALLIMALADWLGGVAGWIAGVLRLIGVLIVLEIVRTSRHLASDLMWIFLIMLFPVLGTAFFVFIGSSLITSKETRSLVKSTNDSARYYKTQNDGAVLQQAIKDHLCFVNKKSSKSEGKFPTFGLGIPQKPKVAY